MRRATVTIADEIEPALDAYIGQQEVALSLTAIMQTALKEFLERRGYAVGQRTFRITPAKKGSGVKDISLHHDRYLASE